MKKFILSVIFLMSLSVMGQDTKFVSLNYSISDFELTQTGDEYHISSSVVDYICLSDTAAPALPFVSVYVLIGNCQTYDGHTVQTSATLVREDVLLAHNSQQVPTSRREFYLTQNANGFSEPSYPSEVAIYTGTHVMGGHRVLSFLICPFHYDASSHNLYLNTSIDLHISLAGGIQTAPSIADAHLKESLSRFVVNPQELPVLYGNGYSPQLPLPSSVTTTPAYEYLIVTCDSLKEEFQRLADWKTMKGVRTKVLTVEDIYSTTSGTRPQLQIKQALADYYEQTDHFLQYVLLAGDDPIVPVERAHGLALNMEKEIECDLFYSSFKQIDWDTNDDGLSGASDDSIDFSSDIIVTRLSVSNKYEARNIVNRILEYEICPDTTNWENNILLCGAQICERYDYPDGYMSDTHYKAEKYLYHDCIEKYWQQGIRYKLYDTGSSFEGDADYDFSAENLHDQLERGYTFVNVDTHGGRDLWKMEYKYGSLAFFEKQDASSVKNISNTIITTSACSTNEFADNEQCMSELLLRNPYSGIIGYYGCSKEGFASKDKYQEGLSLKYNRKMYEMLFKNPHCQLGRAVYESKRTFLASCTYKGNNLYRWLMYGLNVMCDPEMPVYLSKPKSFKNVHIGIDSHSLLVDTGEDDCRICVMSCTDGGESYYTIENSTDHSEFNLEPGSYVVCITKAGYIPFIAVTGDTIYIQDETIKTDYHVVGKQVFIGNAVTTGKPEGDVTILRGSTVISNHGTVNIPSGFEVKKGAQFEIITTNH